MPNSDNIHREYDEQIKRKEAILNQKKQLQTIQQELRYTAELEDFVKPRVHNIYQYEKEVERVHKMTNNNNHYFDDDDDDLDLDLDLENDININGTNTTTTNNNNNDDEVSCLDFGVRMHGSPTGRRKKKKTDMITHRQNKNLQQQQKQQQQQQNKINNNNNNNNNNNKSKKNSKNNNQFHHRYYQDSDEASTALLKIYSDICEHKIMPSLHPDLFTLDNLNQKAMKINERYNEKYVESFIKLLKTRISCEKMEIVEFSDLPSKITEITQKKESYGKKKSIANKKTGTDSQESTNAYIQLQKRVNDLKLFHVFCRILPKFEKLKKLEIVNQVFTMNEIQLLSKGLENNKTIQHFNLSGTNIGDKGLIVLYPSIGTICAQYLNLSRIGITSESSIYLVSILKMHNARRDEATWSINLRSSTWIAPQSKASKINSLGVICFDLSHNKLTDEFATIFAQYLVYDSWLLGFNINGNMISQKGKGEIYDNLKENSHLIAVVLNNTKNDKHSNSAYRELIEEIDSRDIPPAYSNPWVKHYLDSWQDTALKHVGMVYVPSPTKNNNNNIDYDSENMNNHNDNDDKNNDQEIDEMKKSSPLKRKKKKSLSPTRKKKSSTIVPPSSSSSLSLSPNKRKLSNTKLVQICIGKVSEEEGIKATYNDSKCDGLKRELELDGWRVQIKHSVKAEARSISIVYKEKEICTSTYDLLNSHREVMKLIAAFKKKIEKKTKKILSSPSPSLLNKKKRHSNKVQEDSMMLSEKESGDDILNDILGEKSSSPIKITTVGRKLSQQQKRTTTTTTRRKISTNKSNTTSSMKKKNNQENSDMINKSILSQLSESDITSLSSIKNAWTSSSNKNDNNSNSIKAAVTTHKKKLKSRSKLKKKKTTSSSTKNVPMSSENENENETEESLLTQRTSEEQEDLIKVLEAKVKEMAFSLAALEGQLKIQKLTNEQAEEADSTERDLLIQEISGNVKNRLMEMWNLEEEK